jgi:hypothetical protein
MFDPLPVGYPLPIPLGLDYKATAIAETLKLVECENCHVEYCYILRDTGIGEEHSTFGLFNKQAEAISKSIAEEKLRTALRDGFDAVPCPSCGRYQKYMVREYSKRRFARWQVLGKKLLTWFAGVVLASLPIYILFGWILFWLCFAAGDVLGVLGMICLLKYYFALARVDPNRQDEAERLKIARERAWPRQVLEKANHPALDKNRICEQLYPRLRRLLGQWQPSVEAMSNPALADQEMRVLTQRVVEDEPLPLNKKDRQEVVDLLMRKASPNRA